MRSPLSSSLIFIAIELVIKLQNIKLYYARNLHCLTVFAKIKWLVFGTSRLRTSAASASYPQDLLPT